MQIANNFAPGATLTTTHSASSYGIPVLLIDGIAYGPSDNIRGDEDQGTAWMMPSIQTGADFIQEFVFGANNRSTLTVCDELRGLANKFLGGKS